MCDEVACSCRNNNVVVSPKHGARGTRLRGQEQRCFERFGAEALSLDIGRAENSHFDLGMRSKKQEDPTPSQIFPGGALVEDGPEVTAKGGQLPFIMTIGGNKETTSWIPYGDAISYAYYGKTEPERVKFIELVLSSGAISIEFKPFLTGVPTTSSFDLSKLRDEMTKHPECALQ